MVINAKNVRKLYEVDLKMTVLYIVLYEASFFSGELLTLAGNVCHHRVVSVAHWSYGVFIWKSIQYCQVCQV